MARLYVNCPCGTRNDRVGGRKKCVSCGRPFPKRRVPKHAETLRDQTYAEYVEINEAIHGGHVPMWGLFVGFDACGVCGRPKPENRRHDRDHDHRTGLPRGLCCVRCNRELLRNSTLEEARAVVAYLERVEAHYEALRAVSV